MNTGIYNFFQNLAIFCIQQYKRSASVYERMIGYDLFPIEW